MATDLEIRILNMAPTMSIREIESEGKFAVIWDTEDDREIERFDTEEAARQFRAALARAQETSR